jgi:DNA-binding NtrC family response regulator
MTRVLVVEDDNVARDLLEEILRGEGYEVDASPDGMHAIERAQKDRYDLVVSDVRMEGAGGLEVLATFQRHQPDAPVILITAFGDVSGAMQAIQKGAYDYVSKPFNVEELKLTVRRALERRRLASARAKDKPAARAGADEANIEDIVGKSPAMLEVYKLVARVAPTTATVLVVGESGTGKELVARAIHTHSTRAAQAFVPVNCTALTESLLESELFGHAKGAFTGAASAKRGLFEESHGGTLFLDEIGDMGQKMQAQLLRALSDGEIRRVGSTEAIKTDVRVVCATNRDLEAEVRAGRFREDLFFRINVVTLRLPPLRERPSDIPMLVAHFLRKYARREGREVMGIAPEALAVLERHSWPGNVRELENVVDRALTLAKGGVILASDLPVEVQGGAAAATAMPAPDGAAPVALLAGDRPTLAELERRYIELVLRETGGNKKRTAEILGIDRRTLYRTLDREKTTGGTGAAPDDDDS